MSEADDGPPQGSGRVVLRMTTGNSTRDVTWNMRIDTFFSSGLAVLEQLIALRGRLRALSTVRGTLNDLLLEHAMQLSLQEAKEQGPPPVTEEDWQNLKVITVSKYHLRDGSNESCCICKEDYVVDQKAVQLPCGHIYCKDCIKEWLEVHRTCPMCREEVVEVTPQKWVLDECGFEQLRGQECFMGAGGSLVILSKCSHSFHRACLRRHLRLRMRDKGETLKVDCPLCHTPNTIARGDLCSGVVLPSPPTAPPCTVSSNTTLKKQAVSTSSLPAHVAGSYAASTRPHARMNRPQQPRTRSSVPSVNPTAAAPRANRADSSR
eukprot:TRINITY_DN27301_c0_g1_i1.p1 TRINITY_DN27301_c0_g1~~TRINITY_DN27301_c0_g1_i1.p1  ORF type:complete len:321 (+),score=15.22 TRINITY_DN27301_c0_g1_i1:2-964(+)